MKKIMKKSPLKVTKDGEEVKVKKEVSKNKWTGTSTIKSASAGDKIKSTTTTVVPAKKSTSNVDALKKGAKNLGPNYKPSAAETARANKRLRDAKAKDAAASTPEQKVESVSANAPEVADNNANSFETDKTTVRGMTAMDARQEGRRDIVLARQAGKLKRKEVKFSEKAAKTADAGKKAVFEAKAEGFKSAGENVQERQMYAKQQAQQGSFGNLSNASTKRQTLGEQEFDKEGLVEGASAVSKSTPAKPVQSFTSNNGFVAPADKVEEKLNLKSSVLKMLKPGTFKMAGFGNKNKK